MKVEIIEKATTEKIFPQILSQCLVISCEECIYGRIIIDRKSAITTLNCTHRELLKTIDHLRCYGV